MVDGPIGARRPAEVVPLRPHRGRPRADENAYHETYIALLDLNFGWRPQDVKRVKDAWRAGKPLDEIARMIRRDADEVAILLMDLARKGEIEPRPRGVYGGRKKR